MRTAELNETARPPAQAKSAKRAVNWPLHAGFLLAALVFVAGYAQSFASLVYVWAHDGTFQYAFFIFPISAMLVWMRRDYLRRLTASPAPVGLAVLGLLGLASTVASAADINIVRHFCAIALIPALVFTFYGPSVTRALLFPLAYLYFGLPFGDFLVGPLREITAHLSVFALSLTPIPVYMAGPIIITPASVWHVAAACSGVKFFFATTAFGALYVNLFFQSWWRRVIFLICAMVVPVIANGLRVFFTIVIGEIFGLHYATGTDHLIFGWQFFGTVLVLLFLAGWPWHESEPSAADRRLLPAGRSPTPARAVMLAAAAVVVLAFGPVWLFSARAVAAQSAHARPARPSAGTAKARPSATGARFVGADATASRRLRGAVAVEYARYDGPPAAGHELITQANRVFDPARWQPAGHAPISGRHPPPGFHALRLHGVSGHRSRLLWYGYRINGQACNSVLGAKAWQAWFTLTARSLASSVVMLSTPANDPRAARARLARALPSAMRWVARGSRP